MTAEKQQTPLQKLKTKLQTLLMAEGLRDAHLGIETSLKYLNDLLPEEKQSVLIAEALGNLLAVLHRDGGHHQQRVGTLQAIKDAHNLLHETWILKENNTLKDKK